MLPSREIVDHGKMPPINFRRLTRLPSNETIERCCFLLIHILFYAIILILVYVRMEKFRIKQETLLHVLENNRNHTDAHHHPLAMNSFDIDQ
jgi:hypothetical protein